MTTHNRNLDIEDVLIGRIRALSSPITPQPTDTKERLMPLSGVRAVLFDIYGTLFISGSGDISIASAMSNGQALSEALACAGFTGRLEEAGIKGCEMLLHAIQATHEIRRKNGIMFPEVNIREEWSHVLMALQENNLLEGNVSYEEAQRVSVEYEFRVNPVWPMQDVQPMLQQLWKKDLLLGIVSNAQFYTLLMFPALFRKSFMEVGFNPYLCAFSYEVREAKPSIKLFQGILDYLKREYDVAAAETLYVGNDMLNDVWTASQCGLKTALFAGDRRSLRLREDDARCTNLIPDVIITSLSQIIAIV